MAYFSKDAYERKSEHAYRVSVEGISKIAKKLSDEYNVGYDDLLEELEPIQQLSHLRHEIHSSKDNGKLDFWNEEYDEIINKVNSLSRKYNLSKSSVKGFDYESLPDLDLDNDINIDILGLKRNEWLDDDGYLITDKKDIFFAMVNSTIRSQKDYWSDNVREWFWHLNKKFGTEFPDKTPSNMSISNTIGILMF